MSVSLFFYQTILQVEQGDHPPEEENLKRTCNIFGNNLNEGKITKIENSNWAGKIMSQIR